MSKKKTKAKSKAARAAADQFGLLPDVKLTKREKDILHLLADAEETKDILYLCTLLDTKPSKIEKSLNALIDDGFLEFDDNDEELFLVITDNGYKYLTRTKQQKANEKKFRKFLSCLNKKELDDFFVLCDKFEYEPEDSDSDEEVENALTELFSHLDEAEPEDLIAQIADKISEQVEEAAQAEEPVEIPVKKGSRKGKKAAKEPTDSE